MKRDTFELRCCKRKTEAIVQTLKDGELDDNPCRADKNQQKKLFIQ